MTTIPKSKARSSAAQILPPVAAPVTAEPIAPAVVPADPAAVEKPGKAAGEVLSEAAGLAEQVTERVAGLAGDALQQGAAAGHAFVQEAEAEQARTAWAGALPAGVGMAELVEVNKDFLDALIASGSVVVGGAQEISRSLMALTLSVWQDQLTAGQALVGSKDLGEAVQMASALTRARFEKLFSESARLGGLSGRIAQEALQPLSGHVETVMRKYGKAA